MTRLAQARSAARFAGGLYRERWDRWYAVRFRGDQLARLNLREGRRDPYAVYEDMRAFGPMVPTRLGNWATTSHPICKQVLRSRQFGVREEDGAVPGGSPRSSTCRSSASTRRTTSGCAGWPRPRSAPG